MPDILRLVGTDTSPTQPVQVQTPRGFHQSQASGAILQSVPSTRPVQQALQSSQQSLSSALSDYSVGLNTRAQRDLEVVQAQQQSALRQSMAKAAAQAQRGEVISSLAQTAAQYLLQRKQVDEAARVRAEEVLKEQRKTNYTNATLALNELKSEAANGGFKQKGTGVYTNSALELIQSTDLDEEDRRALIKDFYSARDDYESKERSVREAAIKDMRVAAREREKQQHLLDLQPTFSSVKDNPYADPNIALQKLREKISITFSNEDYTPSEKDDMVAALMREASPYVGSNVQAQVKLARLQQDIQDFKAYEADQVLQYQNGVVNRQQLLSNLATFKEVKGLSGVQAYDPKSDLEFASYQEQLTKTRTSDVEADIRTAADGAALADDHAINAYAIQLATSMGGVGIEELKKVRGEDKLTLGEKKAVLRAEAINKLREQEASLVKEVASISQDAADVNASTLLTMLRERRPLSVSDQAAISTLPQDVIAKALAGQQLSPEEMKAVEEALTQRRTMAGQRVSEASTRLQQTKAQLAQFGYVDNPDELNKYLVEGTKKWEDYKKRWMDASQQFMGAYQKQRQDEMSQPGLGVRSPFESGEGEGGILPSGKFVNLPRVNALGDTYITGKRVILPFAAEDRNNIDVTSPWAVDRGDHKHAGLDISVDEGTRVVSPIDGVVRQVRYDAQGYGYYVDVLGSDGMMYRYGHLKRGSVKVKAGDKVAAGSVFASTGNTGRSSGPHLHFEVRDPEKPYGFDGTVDPVGYLSAANFNTNVETQMRTSGLVAPVTAAGVTLSSISVPTTAAPLGNGWFLANNRVYSLGPNTTQVEDRGTSHDYFHAGRPMYNSYTQSTLPAGSKVINDKAANYGYSILAKDAELRKAMSEVGDKLNIPAMWLADVISLESGFDHKVVNSVGAVGLIQFMPETAKSLGYTTEQIRSMSPAQQVRTVVYDYLKDARTQFKSIHELYVFINGGLSGLRALRKNPLSNWGDGNGRWREKQFLLLGKAAGRQYEIPMLTRKESLTSAVHTSYTEGCKVCASLSKSGSDIVPHHPQVG